MPCRARRGRRYCTAKAVSSSTLAQDVVLAERFGYDYIEIRLDMLQEWLQKHTLSELADIFA
ncbi:hypothetical protein KU616_24170, partial [Salmonella enterica subsp. enterica serovar Mbandaka]|nr:hypothetical protein [Salmonella enterica subsp. enterica serovar Mbandaka]